VWGYSYKAEGLGTYFKSLPLPSYVSSEGAKASFHRGVLTVRFPKHPSSRPRVIPVDAKGKEIWPGSMFWSRNWDLDAGEAQLLDSMVEKGQGIGEE